MNLDRDLVDELEAEFCRACGVPVSWTSEMWVHDYSPDDDHEPIVPGQEDF